MLQSMTLRKDYSKCVLPFSCPRWCYVRRRESLTPFRTKVCIHTGGRSALVFETIGKIYRGRSNCGVITEIGPLYIIYGFFLLRLARRALRLDGARKIRLTADADII